MNIQSAVLKYLLANTDVILFVFYISLLISINMADNLIVIQFQGHSAESIFKTDFLCLSSIH